MCQIWLSPARHGQAVSANLPSWPCSRWVSHSRLFATAWICTKRWKFHSNLRRPANRSRCATNKRSDEDACMQCCKFSRQVDSGDGGLTWSRGERLPTRVRIQTGWRATSYATSAGLAGASRCPAPSLVVRTPPYSRRQCSKWRLMNTRTAYRAPCWETKPSKLGSSTLVLPMHIDTLVQAAESCSCSSARGQAAIAPSTGNAALGARRRCSGACELRRQSCCSIGTTSFMTGADGMLLHETS